MFQTRNVLAMSYTACRYETRETVARLARYDSYYESAEQLHSTRKLPRRNIYDS